MTRAEQRSLASELKQFSFEGNAAFRNGQIHDVEREYTYYLRDDSEFSHWSEDAPEVTTVKLGFIATRELRDGKPRYEYALRTEVSRPLDEVPSQYLEDFRVDDEADEDIDDDDLMESQTTTLIVNDDSLEYVQSTYEYTIYQYGDAVVEQSTDDMLSSGEGEYVTMPPEELFSDHPSRFVPAAIEHDQLDDPVERFTTDFAFQQIITKGKEDGVDISQPDIGDVANHIRQLIHIMRTGELPF